MKCKTNQSTNTPGLLKPNPLKWHLLVTIRCNEHISPGSFTTWASTLIRSSYTRFFVNYFFAFLGVRPPKSTTKSSENFENFFRTERPEEVLTGSSITPGSFFTTKDSWETKNYHQSNSQIIFSYFTQIIKVQVLI